ncbi:MAG TPA: FecR domain-containing protein [Steroidobacteraceae bacterium]
MRFPFGKTSRVREEALVWLARLKRGLRPAEGQELVAWLKRRSHRMAIASAAAEWHGPEVLAVLSEIFPIPAAVLEPRRGLHPLLGVAAFIGACITIGPPIAALLRAGIHGSVYATAAAATRQLTLEDGTRVALNRGSQINVTYAQYARSVLVARGEALINVASAPARPFYIHAAGRNFETEAATFDVRFITPDTLSITVLKGTVTVYPPPRPLSGHKLPILLEPLQMLVMEPDRESGQALSQQDVRSQLAWQRGT